jgi:hypothetical protein
MRCETRKIDRTPQDKARIRAIREKFRHVKPSLKKLVQSGDAPPPIQLATYLEKATSPALEAITDFARIHPAFTSINRRSIFPSFAVTRKYPFSFVPS